MGNSNPETILHKCDMLRPNSSGLFDTRVATDICSADLPAALRSNLLVLKSSTAPDGYFSSHHPIFVGLNELVHIYFIFNDFYAVSTEFLSRCSTYMPTLLSFKLHNMRGYSNIYGLPSDVSHPFQRYNPCDVLLWIYMKAFWE